MESVFHGETLWYNVSSHTNINTKGFIVEICVMASFSFFNEDSEIVRFEGVELKKHVEHDKLLGDIEQETEVIKYKDGSQTTLKAMYVDGWTLKQVKPIRMSHGVMLFLER